MGAMRHCQLQWGSILREHFTILLTQFSSIIDQGQSHSEDTGDIKGDKRFSEL